MQEILDQLTLRSFIVLGFGGALCGYVLRVLEHVIWNTTKCRGDEPRGPIVSWAFMVLPQSLLFGVSLGYVAVAILARNYPARAIVEGCSILIPATIAFVAVDVRNLLRRIKQ